MPFNLPTSVTSLITSDSATTRALTSLKSAVDPLLQVVSTCFDVLSDGTMRVKRIVRGLRSSDPVFTGTTQADKMTANSVTSSSITSTGSIVSSTGFRSAFDMGTYFNSSSATATRYRTIVVTQNVANAGFFQMPTLFQPNVNGSIVGIQTWSMGTVGGTVNVQLYKNQTTPTTPLVDVAVGSAAQYFGATVAYPKGLYTFVPLDYYITTVTFSVAGNQCVAVRLLYELSA